GLGADLFIVFQLLEDELRLGRALAPVRKEPPFDRNALVQREPSLCWKPGGRMFEVFDLVFWIGASLPRAADEELEVPCAIGHGERGQVPDALSRTRRWRAPEQRTSPLDELRRRVPVDVVEPHPMLE